MERKTAAIFLAHVNPLTISHEAIIRNLLQNYSVYVFPVRFLKNDVEINTRSFPFSYEIRKQMILESFDYNENIHVIGDYAFRSPYVQYFPPFISPAFKRLKDKIIFNIKENSYITYTGDRAERILLSLFGFNPIKANRQIISSTNVKNLLYNSVIRQNDLDSSNDSQNNTFNWLDFVSPKVGEVIMKNWETIKNFSISKDETIRVMGMKFPKNGFI
ncbi:MAG: hypothetical protein AB7V56_02825 [Candidatus Nitrosocosmicus sp.]|jgi:hypothetical protein|uniref:hypothetical protein n=1 Tax=Candidatus Nitrosocosmicus agrestis TaxID=2563600 RepID=UPI00122E0C4D|nr:hypothetical protein [Candidatus Nitrosocosmicus sp. SS]KAA2279103.1 hypothetical protein F1Z66_14285 [Candidatus Nitrosocosmicus sp. SS]KAF0867700.1 hypothetical protein E5N71_14020 [Candidatus Nitrosocosmicus sp. SS]MDR4489916.1 hypothetical protein [Candidatus Nitrosocosmicus sp.]